ncbi:pantetheine-phosphate adenylyltransferase [Anaeromassilibacillus senegalensis]|uniref:pantetheine-phosphate adenylyltransferase n=1 Tax=Anaeromassilibacillus senegalensis TaxID=1673717 RepID=UPI00067FEBC3|nr:pantetheine-phosphate adenylyltransferase [Anaeromassilibacillus senegalensis]
MKTAICPGSFDPVTIGHLDIIGRARKIFDHVIVAVMVNPKKNTLFTAEERVTLIQKCIGNMDDVEVVCFDGLLADYARIRSADAIVKGLRALSDFEYEFQQALTNKKLNPQLETMFLITRSENMFLSSSIVKQIAGFGGDISNFVPACILEDIKERIYASKG